MRDPERVFQVGPDGEFDPVSFTQDNVGPTTRLSAWTRWAG